MTGSTGGLLGTFKAISRGLETQANEIQNQLITETTRIPWDFTNQLYSAVLKQVSRYCLRLEQNQYLLALLHRRNATLPPHQRNPTHALRPCTGFFTQMRVFAAHIPFYSFWLRQNKQPECGSHL